VPSELIASSLLYSCEIVEVELLSLEVHVPTFALYVSPLRGIAYSIFSMPEAPSLAVPRSFVV